MALGGGKTHRKAKEGRRRAAISREPQAVLSSAPDTRHLASTISLNLTHHPIFKIEKSRLMERKPLV